MSTAKQTVRSKQTSEQCANEQQKSSFAQHTWKSVVCPTFHAPFIFPALRVIEFHGWAKASSRLRGKVSWENAFNGENGEVWISNYPSHDPTPMIWYQFKEAHTLAKIGFSSRRLGNLNETPAHFLVIGSTMTDNCNKWSTLLEVKNAGFTEHGEFKSWLIPAERKPYHCIGLKIVSNLRGSGSPVLTNIVMWD